MEGIIKNSDLMSEKPQLFNKGKTRYSSLLGSFITITKYLLATGAFGYFFSKIIQKKEFNVSTRNFFNLTSQMIINTNDTIMAFRVLDRLAAFYEEEENFLQYMLLIGNIIMNLIKKKKSTEWKYNIANLGMTKFENLD